MKNLENIIRSNRDQFDGLEPSEGHFERFHHKLKEHHKKNRSFHWTVMLKAAAIAILVVLSGLWVYDQVGQNESPKQIALEKAPSEVQEAHVYYSSLMQKKYEQIKAVDFRNEQQKKLLLQELKDMDSIYVNIRDDLKMNPNDPRVMNALITHYQMKLEVMNQILQQLREINEQTKSNEPKNKKHETTEI